jgi:hypothetical protein
MIVDILIWIAVTLIVTGLMHFFYKFFAATVAILIEDKQWGLLAIVAGLIILGISMVIHTVTLGR